MYKVMLVDDEYLELELLEQHIDWEALGFTVSATAKNGKDALAKIALERPDVLITDVRMPFMDGVELSRAVHEQYPEIRIIFLSGYNQFEYMKAALRVGAMDYLIKPLELTELTALLKDVAKRCASDRNPYRADRAVIAEWLRHAYDQANQEHTQEERLLHAFASCFPGVKEFYVTLFTINELKYLLNIDDNRFFTISQYQKVLNGLVRNTSGVLSAIRENRYVLITAESPAQHIKAWKQENQSLQEFITVCLFGQPVEIADIPHTVAALADYSDWYVYRNGPGHIMSPKKRPPAVESAGQTRNSDILPRLIDAVGANRAQDIEGIMARYYAQPVPEDMHNQTLNLLDQLYTSAALPPGVAKGLMQRKRIYFNRLLWIESITLLKSVVTRHIVALAQDADRSVKEDGHVLLVRRIKEYIEANYSRAFSIDELGEAVNYSPNYLRNIYKKYTGDTVLEAITQVRMRHAEELLQDSRLTIRKISQQVGYTNPSYFCTQFLKLHGVSPQQYRTGGLP